MTITKLNIAPVLMAGMLLVFGIVSFQPTTVAAQTVAADELQSFDRTELISLIQGLLEQLINRSASPVVQDSDVVTLSRGDIVSATDNLRIRNTAGAEGDTLRVVNPGTSGVIEDGPTTRDGLLWWRIRYDDGMVGWSAADWLRPIATGNDDGDVANNREVIDSDDDSYDLYGFSDVRTITATVFDPSTASDDEYTEYSVVLNDGREVTFTVLARELSSVVEARVRATGYRGDVDELLTSAERRVGKVDDNDETPQCPMYNIPRCDDDERLVSGGFFENGCSKAPVCIEREDLKNDKISCPLYSPPRCADNEVLVSGGMLENGCSAAPVCARPDEREDKNLSCPIYNAPRCAANEILIEGEQLENGCAGAPICVVKDERVDEKLACPLFSPPLCSDGEVLVAGGVLENGCAAAPVCAQKETILDDGRVRGAWVTTQSVYRELLDRFTK